MSLVISHNFAASYAARQLEINDDNLRNSLGKLASGKRIVRPTDDAAGMAVELKLKASVARGAAAKNNIQNGISFLQTQDGILTTAVAVVSRIGELRAMATDATKNSDDVALYDLEYQVLRQQLIDLQSEKFNEVSMFVAAAGDQDSVDDTVDGVFKIYTTEQGSAIGAPSVTFEGVHLGTDAGGGGVLQQVILAAHSTAGGGDLTGLTMDNILDDLQNLANARAKNGAVQSRLGYAYDNASISKSNMEAARSRIIDVDIAEESTKFASYNILTQASASILAQANQTGRTALQLLMT
jgi:flagellin